MTDNYQEKQNIEGSGRHWRESPTSPSQKKPWWQVYGATIGVTFFVVLVVWHQNWFERSNPPPALSQLERQQIEVLNWQHLHPQLHVRLASGKERMVEFPTLSLRRDMYFVISHEQQRQLVGKTCQMWGRPLRASFEDHYQVFALDCGDGVGLRFEQALRDYTSSFKSRQSPLTGFLFVFITWLIAFLAETIRHRKSQKQGDQS